MLRKPFMSGGYSGLILFIGLAFVGCSDNDFAEVPVQPVSGKLLVKGQPAYGAYIVFHPADSVGMTKGNKPFARVAQDGTFTITTYNSNDGAPIGDFNVTITWPEEPESRGPSPDRLKGRYETPEKSGLNVHIDSDTRELPAWDLD